MKHVLRLAPISLGLVMLSSSAFAAVTPVSVPEPMSMSLLAGGVVAIAAIKRMRRK